jgi:hypothetical protein
VAVGGIQRPRKKTAYTAEYKRTITASTDAARIAICTIRTWTANRRYTQATLDQRKGTPWIIAARMTAI